MSMRCWSPHRARCYTPKDCSRPPRRTERCSLSGLSLFTARIVPMALDLAAARLRLMERKQELEQRSAHAKADMRHESDPLVADFADQATQREDDEVLAQLSDSADAELLQIRRAL